MITQAIGNVLGYIMYACYQVVHDYGLAIIIFTFFTKIVLLPISVMVQKNSIKMVKLYPQMNRIKAKYFGNRDMISEEQYKLYQKEKYHPMLDLVPVILQLIILMGVVDVIYRPISHLLHAAGTKIQELVAAYCSLSGVSSAVSSIQIQVVNHITDAAYLGTFKGICSAELLEKISSIDMSFFGINLGNVPVESLGTTMWIPVLAALSAWLMCFAQNKINVLQSEQSKLNQYTTLAISVLLSLYLGFFVPAGVGLYWIFSNLFSILQLFLLNLWINPKKYIDYESLQESREELLKVTQYSRGSKEKREKSEVLLEKQDYKRFMKYGEKQLVFYSEKNGFYKYYQNVIETILKKTDIVIHYITSDPHDEVFSMAGENFRVYYIGENKLIVLMMKLEADMVVMTMPDLQKYHIKRSMVKDDIEYVYLDHGIGSLNMMLRKHAVDYFDTIFTANDKCFEEMRAQEKCYQLKEKTLVKWGSGLIDNMIENYQKDKTHENLPKEILIAPSWQEDNLLDSCIEPLLNGLLGQGYHVTLRPHPQYVRHYKEKLQTLAERYEKEYSDFTLQTDFASNQTVFDADILITDWSGIAYEYSFATCKPTLFIDTPMKVMNPDYEEVGVVPFDVEIRNQIGISVKPKDLSEIGAVVNRLLTDQMYTVEEMEKVREKYLYNVGNSGAVGADYIIKKLIEYSKR